MVGVIIIGKIEVQRGEGCLDSPSSQVARPGFQLKSADSKRHAKIARGPFEEEQAWGY